MKTGDVLIVVATMGVVVALIAYPIDLACAATLGLVSGILLSLVVCIFVSALFSGVVFAGKIQESRWIAIAKITVVWGLLIYIYAIISQAYSAGGTYAIQSYNGQYGATLSASQSVYWQIMFGDMVALEIVAIAIVATFVGLTIGSMLRKPKKT